MFAIGCTSLLEPRVVQLCTGDAGRGHYTTRAGRCLGPIKSMLRSGVSAAAVERMGERYAESLTEQLHVPSVGLIRLISCFTRLISCPHSLFFRGEASYASTIDRPSPSQSTLGVQPFATQTLLNCTAIASKTDGVKVDPAVRFITDHESLRQLICHQGESQVASHLHGPWMSSALMMTSKSSWRRVCSPSRASTPQPPWTHTSMPTDSRALTASMTSSARIMQGW